MGQPVIELHRPPACSGLGSQVQRSAVELGSLGQIGQMRGAGRMLERLLYSRVDSKYCGTLATSDEGIWSAVVPIMVGNSCRCRFACSVIGQVCIDVGRWVEPLQEWE